tara:strand:+ start:2378 stop:2923 length:546 start_codon:yes stop_codon:yes gene_type:complete
MEREILYEISYFIMNNPGKLIRFLNNEGYRVPMNATTQQLNDIVADGLFNRKFTEDLIKFVADNAEYLNVAYTAIATAAAAVGQVIGELIISAKMAVFGKQQTYKAEVYSKELSEWQKDQAEIAAKKQMSLELSRMQSDIILDRDIQEEKQKSKRNMMMFGMFAVGAIVLTFIAKQLKDNN